MLYTSHLTLCVATYAEAVTLLHMNMKIDEVVHTDRKVLGFVTLLS